MGKINQQTREFNITQSRRYKDQNVSQMSTHAASSSSEHLKPVRLPTACREGSSLISMLLKRSKNQFAPGQNGRVSVDTAAALCQHPPFSAFTKVPPLRSQTSNRDVRRQSRISGQVQQEGKPPLNHHEQSDWPNYLLKSHPQECSKAEISPPRFPPQILGFFRLMKHKPSVSN